MSSDDITLVSQVLLGILNPNDTALRTNSANKLQELMKNLGAISFCLLQIASKQSKTKEEIILKTSSLVILRKILDVSDYEQWEKIQKDLKEQIKLNTLQLFVNETEMQFKSKISDVVTEIVDKIAEEKGEWPDFVKLASTLLTIDPNDANQTMSCCSLMKLIANGIGFLFDDMIKGMDVLLAYFKKIFEGSNMKVKIATCNLISEMTSVGNTKEIQNFLPFFYTMLEITLQLFNSKQEDDLKEMMQIVIELCTIQPKEWSIHFANLFLLSKTIYEYKGFADEMLRELGFELILSLVERKPSLMDTNNLKILLEAFFKYGLETEKEITKEWEMPLINNYEDIKEIEEEKICSMKLLVERIIECIGIEIVLPILGELINNLLAHSDWMYKYSGLAVLSDLCMFEKEMNNIQMAFPTIFALCKNENAKIRYLSVHSISKCSHHFNPKFQKAYVDVIIPLLMELSSKETILRIQCEIFSALEIFIEFTTSEKLSKYNAKLFEMIFASFLNNIPIILRKQLVELLIELGSTLEDDCTPYAQKSFEILFNYFEKLYSSKSNRILYGGLIETLTIFGPYTPNTFNPCVPGIMQAILDLIQSSNSENDPIRSDLTSSIERILPVIQKDFKNLTPVLIQSVYSLIKKLPQVTTGNTQIDINELFNESKQTNCGMELNTEGMEDYAHSLALLFTIIDTLKEEFAPFVDQFEKELFPLALYKFSLKIRNKASKILPLMITVLSDQKVIKEKAKLYIDMLVTSISKETDNCICKKMVKYLNHVIENAGMILTKEEVNALFKKLMSFINGLEHNRNKLKKEMNIKKPIAKDDDSDDENIDDVIEDDLEELESILNNINDSIGILFKTHKDLCDDILQVIISDYLPKIITKNASQFEQKTGLYLCVDLIEFVGQKKLIAIWDNLFKQLVFFSTQEDTDIRQAAAYGIGVFAQCTSENFDKYAFDAITALKSAMNFPMDPNYKEDWYLAHDNIIAAFGKILYYQQASTVVQSNLNELLDLWIGNLPIVYEDDEKETQHEWLSQLALYKRAALPASLYPKMFKSLAQIYDSKGSNEDIDGTIEKLFLEVKQLPDMRVIIDQLYQTSETKVKRKLEALIRPSQ